MGPPGCVTLRSMRSQNPHPNVAKSATLGWGTQCSDGSRAFMDIEGWRKKIDELDQKLVELISERARAAVAIGNLKPDPSMPIYEPDRERIVLYNVPAANQSSPLGLHVARLYGREVG